MWIQTPVICNNDIEPVELKKTFKKKCNLVNTFWNEVLNWIKKKNIFFYQATWDMVKFGGQKCRLCYKQSISYKKYFIHECEVLKTAPV